MIISEKEEWKEFLLWLERNENNFPDWLDKEMTLHQAQIIWRDKVKYVNQ